MTPPYSLLYSQAFPAVYWFSEDILVLLCSSLYVRSISVLILNPHHLGVHVFSLVSIVGQASFNSSRICKRLLTSLPLCFPWDGLLSCSGCVPVCMPCSACWLDILQKDKPCRNKTLTNHFSMAIK